MHRAPPPVIQRVPFSGGGGSALHALRISCDVNNAYKYKMILVNLNFELEKNHSCGKRLQNNAPIQTLLLAIELGRLNW